VTDIRASLDDVAFCSSATATADADVSIDGPLFLFV
jgi:hypothetical protein